MRRSSPTSSTMPWTCRRRSMRRARSSWKERAWSNAGCRQRASKDFWRGGTKWRSRPHRGAPRERREHGKGAFEHFHVPPHLVLERAERTSPEGLRHLLAKFFLLARKRIDGDFEIARDQHLHTVAVEADELAQKGDRHQALPLLVLLLENDLCQDLAGDVLAGLGVVDDEILARLHHGREVFERDVGARAGIVEPSVGVFLDRDRFRSHW